MSEIGAEAVQVGYGGDGTGAVGNNAEEVQRLVVSGIPAAGNAEFQLFFPSDAGRLLLDTATLSAQRIAQQLENRTGPGNVTVREIAPTVAGTRSFDIRFVNRWGRQDIREQLSAEPFGGNVPVPANFATATSTQWDGRSTATKRLGFNRLDQTDGAGVKPTTRLLYDFDDGTAARDALGGNTGLGNNREAMVSPGDSGGPLLVNIGGGELRIAGIQSGLRSSVVDATDYRNSAGGQRGDSSFGEVSIVTRVQSYATNFIDPVTAGPYRVSLDMNRQVLGRDNIAENLTIRHRVIQIQGVDFLDISVSGSQDNAFNGSYFSQPAANAQEFTIRGTDGDRDTYRQAHNINLRFDDTVVGQLENIDRWELDGGTAVVRNSHTIQEFAMFDGEISGESALIVSSTGEWSGGLLSGTGV